MECSTEDLHCREIQGTNPVKVIVGSKNKFLGVSVPSKRSTCVSCWRQFPASTVTNGKLNVCYRQHVRVCGTK